MKSAKSMVVFGFCFFANLYAQQPAHFFIGVDQFSGIQIYDVIQDQKKNYLFATSEGIYYFDYYSYEKIECENTKSRSVFNFTKDNEGHIYCHNLNNQIFQISGRDCKLFYELKKDETRADISLSITSAGNLLIGARKIIELNKRGDVKSKFTCQSYLGPPYTDNSNEILFHLGESDSILIYSNGTPHKHQIKTPSGKLQVDGVLKFFNLGSGVCALDLKAKILYRYQKDSFNLVPLTQNLVFQRSESVRIYEVGNDAWVAGTLPGIALVGTNNTGGDNEIYYQDYFISDAFKDEEGNILLSTFGKGILVIPDLRIPDVINSFRDDPVTAIYSDSQIGIILGSSKGQLMSYSNKKIQLINDKGKRPVEGIYGYNGSDLILFDNGHIRAYNKKTGAFNEVMGASLKDAAFVSKDQFYIGTNLGVMKIKWDGGNEFDAEKVKGLQGRSYSIEYCERDSCLYASTANGLYVVLKNGKTEKITLEGNDIFPNDLFCNKKQIYAPTEKNGVLVIEKGNVIKTIFPMVGGKSEALNKLLIHNGQIIASSANGFFQFNMSGELTKAIHSFYGFSSKTVIDFAFVNDSLWVSHSGGVQQLDLNYSKLQKSIPHLQIDKVMVNDKDVDLLKFGNFSSDQRKIQFVFSSPTLRNRDAIHYYYQLLGHNEEWNINNYGSNKVTYNALSPGTYTLNIKAESQGAFSEVESYSFTIAPPFYFNFWFIASLIFGFIGIVIAVYFRQLKIQRRKLQQINELNNSKLTAIQSQMNPHFIFNSLNSIQDLILKGDVEYSYSYITTFSNLVRRTLDYSERDFIDFEQEIELLELYLSLEKLRFKKDFNYTIELNNVREIMVPPLLIQPFVENSLVHGLLHRKGTKSLTISFHEKEVLYCTIKDNGVGREKAKAIKQRQGKEHISFSGKAIRKRFDILSEVFEGEFGYEYKDLSEHGEAAGTTVILKIPVKRKF